MALRGTRLWTDVRNNLRETIPSHHMRKLVAVSRVPIPGHPVVYEAPLMGAGWQTQAYRSPFVPVLVMVGGWLTQGAALAWSPPFPVDTGKGTSRALPSDSSVKAGWG